MWIVAIGVGLVVLYLARKTPNVDASASTALGPDTSISALGAANVPSPATANGRSLRNYQNQIALETNYAMAMPSDKLVSSQSPGASWSRRKMVQASGADYLTDAQSSLRTQEVPALTQQMPAGVDLPKL